MRERLGSERKTQGVAPTSRVPSAFQVASGRNCLPQLSSLIGPLRHRAALNSAARSGSESRSSEKPTVWCTWRVGPGNFHPEPLNIFGLDTLASSGSRHRSSAAPSVRMLGSSRCRLAQPNADDPPPSLQPHYRAFITTTRQSAPLRRIGTFGLAVGAACAFSLGIADQVLTFHIRAWLSFAPPTCPSAVWAATQDIPQTNPGRRVSPWF